MYQLKNPLPVDLRQSTGTHRKWTMTWLFEVSQELSPTNDQFSTFFSFILTIMQ